MAAATLPPTARLPVPLPKLASTSVDPAPLSLTCLLPVHADLLPTSDDGRPEPQQGGVKRRRSEPEAIDLEAEEEEEASAARQRIMQFARRVNAERAAQVAGLEGAPQAQQQQEQQQQATGGTSGEQQQQEAGAAPPANTLLAQLHAERMARQAQRQPPLQQQQYQQQQPAGGRTEQRAPPALPHQYPTAAEQQQQRQGGASGSIKLLTWNVWFAEEVHVQARMAAIGRVIEERQPDFVTLQVGLWVPM